jgi:hypothetical protein
LGCCHGRIACSDSKSITRSFSTIGGIRNLNRCNALQNSGTAGGGGVGHNGKASASLCTNNGRSDAVAACNLGVDAAFIESAALTFDFELLVAELFFGLLGAGLAFGFCDAAQFFHAGTVAFSLGASATAKHGEEVGAAGGSHARAKFGKPLQRLILHVRGNAIAKYVEERFGHGWGRAL